MGDMGEIDFTHFWCLFIALMKLHNEIQTNLYRHHKVSHWVLLILRIGFWMCDRETLCHLHNVGRISFLRAVSGLHVRIFAKYLNFIKNAQLCHLSHITKPLKEGVSKTVFLLCYSKLRVKFALRYSFAVFTL